MVSPPTPATPPTPRHKGYSAKPVTAFFKQVSRTKAMRTAESRETEDVAAMVRGRKAHRKIREKRDKMRKAAEEPMVEEPAEEEPAGEEQTAPPIPTNTAPPAVATDTMHAPHFADKDAENTGTVRPKPREGNGSARTEH